MTVKEFLEKAKPDSVYILWTYYKVAEGTPSELRAMGNEAMLGAVDSGEVAVDVVEIGNSVILHVEHSKKISKNFSICPLHIAVERL